MLVKETNFAIPNWSTKLKLSNVHPGLGKWLIDVDSFKGYPAYMVLSENDVCPEIAIWMSKMMINH